MPSLPLGAARQHPVDPTLLDYDHIVGIEYIEIPELNVYPRSMAYRSTQKGAQLRTRELDSPDIVDSDLDPDEARAYIATLVESGIFAWRRVYRPAQGTFTLECCIWRLEVTFACDLAGKTARPFRVEGENVFPADYESCVAALMHTMT